jgi:hypothetical protein
MQAPFEIASIPTQAGPLASRADDAAFLARLADMLKTVLAPSTQESAHIQLTLGHRACGLGRLQVIQALRRVSQMPPHMPSNQTAIPT